MARSIPRKTDCRFDHLVQAAITQGYGTELQYNGIETYERADDIRKGIYRCAKHRGVSAQAGVSRLVTEPDDMGIHKNRDGTYTLRYKIWDKKGARKRHLERYGADRANWPYDPRRGYTPEEKEASLPRNELGQPVTHKN